MPPLRIVQSDNSRDWYQLQRHRVRAKHQRAIEPFCRFCAEKGIASSAELADHIQPHRGDWNSFRMGELQSLCWHCHSQIKQAMERRASRKPIIGLDGFLIDQGEPAAGKAPSAAAPSAIGRNVISDIADLIS